MARETQEKMTGVTIRVPIKMYQDYKKALQRRGAIVTYDLRNHMQQVISEVEKGQDK